MKKIVTFCLALIMCINIFSLCCFAEDDYTYDENDYTPGYSVEPIPLLVVVISFDANGNGEDDHLKGRDCKDRSLDCYGEQWAYSKEAYWENEIFGDKGKTLNNYYRYNSHDAFYFLPASETYGKENNGIVYVTVTGQHPHAREGTPYSVYGNERHFALAAASEFVDFPSFDKNGDGNIDYTELSISFIIAGYNVKFTGELTDQYFGMNNFEVSTSGWYAEIDGVKLINSTSGGRFTYNGEFAGTGKPIAFGTIAHELGHVLGASDLYTYSGYTWCGGPGEAALQGGGSANKYDGEEAGKSPAAIDPYYLIYYGFEDYTVVNDGEYTLYSKESKLGDYNILRINTTSPYEYYLIENRYYSGSDTYDAIDNNAKAIMIWHVDELIMSSYSLPNCYKSTSPHAPGLTPLYPNGGIGGANYNAWDKDDGVFDSSNYKFFHVNAPYTIMSVEEAEEAGFSFKLEVTSKKSTEMKVRITGTIKTPAEYKMSCSNDKLDEIILRGSLIRLNNSTIQNIKCEISKSNNFSNIIDTLYAKPDSNGEFIFNFKNLDQNGTYYCKTTMKTANGDRVITSRVYTVSPPNQNKDYYIAYMYKNLSDGGNRPFEIKVKLGDKITYSFPMKKTGYVLAGWYTEATFENLYDLNTVRDSNENIYLYAKWIEEDKAIVVNFHNETVTTSYYEIGERIQEPVVEEIEGKIFKGWYTDPEFINRFSFDEQIDELKTIDLYAKFEDEKQTETTIEETTIVTENIETTKIEETTNGEKDDSKKPLHPTVLFTIISVSVILVLMILLVVVKKVKKNNNNIV